MQSSTKRWWRAFAALLALSLIAAACGDDDDTASNETGVDETTTTEGDTPTENGEAPDGTPVTIGIVYSETGRSASTYGDVDSVGEAWAEWVNTEHGGVNGHPVEVKAYDAASTGEGALAAAQEAISDGVVGIIIQDSTAENAITEAITSAGIPMIGGTANSRPMDTGDTHWPNTYFNTAPSNPSSAAAAVLAASAAGLESFAAAVCAEVPACAQAGILYELVAPGAGIEYAGLVTVGAAEPSYTAPCLELINLGADVINLGLAPQTAVSVVEECALQGYEGAYAAIMNTVTGADFEDLGVRLVGGINGFPWWADAEPAQAFRDAFETYGDGSDIRNPSITTTWSALELFRAAMEDYGPAADEDVTTQSVIEAYHQIDGETLDGLLPQPISYVEDGFQPLIKCFWLFEMDDQGEFSTLTQGESGNEATGDLQTSCFSLG
jgi:branched-chain amino acid transport system substrate-binding protein